MPRLARPIARALEDWIDANWPIVEPLNPRHAADHVNALHLPGLAGQTATPANVRAAAAALGKTLGRVTLAAEAAADLAARVDRLERQNTANINTANALVESINARFNTLEKRAIATHDLATANAARLDAILAGPT